jgi:hypothetical protein
MKNNGTPLKPKKGVFRYIILKLIRVYQIFLSPFLGKQCRFYPTCSSYSQTLFTYYSIPKALFLTINRILRCNPYSEGGVDLPPGMTESDIKEHLRDIQKKINDDT